MGEVVARIAIRRFLITGYATIEYVLYTIQEPWLVLVPSWRHADARSETRGISSPSP